MSTDAYSALGTNDNVRVFRLLCILLGICKISLSSNIVAVAHAVDPSSPHRW